MCGIAGYLDLAGKGRVEKESVGAMVHALRHRGPDAVGLFVDRDIGFGCSRLRILDLATGDQPLFNEDRTIALVCNGEIFNYTELREELLGRGHVFRTRTDVEVLLHLYEEEGEDLVERLNGQFAFAIYDQNRRRLFMARDHFGIAPLYFGVFDGLLVFASEVKALLRNPAVRREIDLIGLDQVLSLPGLVSPRTMFKGIESLRSGYCLSAGNGSFKLREYWDLDYPDEGDEVSTAEGEAVEELRWLFQRSVKRRRHGDVPVGVFVSGGMDSALVAAVALDGVDSASRHTFSITFDDCEIDEGRFQQLLIHSLQSRHHEVHIDDEGIARRLEEMVFHCESPVKETFNTCVLALAEAVREAGVTVVLGGEGADELFGGYPGYRFDALGTRQRPGLDDVEIALEEELQERLWGDGRLFYEKDQVAFRDTKVALYSPAVRDMFNVVDCLAYPLVNPARVRRRHVLHQRSYLDFKLRLADHLLSEHGDRMVMANSVEARYPFLDIDLVRFAARLPPSLKVRGATEKYIVKQMARGMIPPQIIEREKFGFRAPGSPLLLQKKVEWVEDLLSFDSVKQRGVFDPAVVELLKRRYAQEGFRLHPHLETDLLMIVLTFNLLCERFALQM